LGDFLDYSPNTEKIDVGGLNLSKVTLAEIIIVIYSVIGYPVWWINKYTKRVFNSIKGFTDRPNGYTDHWDRSDKKTVWDFNHPGKNPVYDTQEFGNYWMTTDPCPDTSNPPVNEFVDPDYKKTPCNNSTLFYEYHPVKPRNTEITSLDFSGTAVTSITVKDLPNLKNFKAYHCSNLTSIDLSGAPNLETIDISDAPSLTSLTVSSTKLIDVTIFNTKISSINFLKNQTSLKNIGIYNNPLSTIDLTNCTNLLLASLRENGFTSVNLTNCTSLESLYLDKNDLTTLDISNCIYLKSLSVSYNFLTTLDISNNSNVYSLDLSFNELTQNAVDDILQKMSQFTDTRTDFEMGFIHLHGGLNARPSFGTDISNAGGMIYYIDLVDPYLSVAGNFYDEGASNLSTLLVNHIATLYNDKFNYAVNPIVGYVPTKNWRIGPPPDMAYKKWEVLISRENLKLIIFGSYQ